MTSALYASLFDQCIQNAEHRSTEAFSPSLDDARARIQRELDQFTKADLLPSLSALAKVVDVAKHENIPFGLWGREHSSMVLFALGLHRVNPLEHGLIYEHWHNEANPNPFDSVGGIFTSLRGRETLQRFLRTSEQPSLEHWVNGCLWRICEEAVVEMVGRDRFERIADDERDGYSAVLQVIPSGMFSDIPVLAALSRPEARDLRPDHVGDVAALFALKCRETIVAGLLKRFINAKHNASKTPNASSEFERFLKHTYGVPVFEEDLSHILNDYLGVPLGESCILIRDIAATPETNLNSTRASLIEGAKTGARSATSIMSAVDFVFAAAPLSASKAQSIGVATSALRRATIKLRFPEEFAQARKMAFKIAGFDIPIPRSIAQER